MCVAFEFGGFGLSPNSARSEERPGHRARAAAGKGPALAAMSCKQQLLRPAPHVITVTVQRKSLLGVSWRHDVKPAVVDKTFKGFTSAEVLFHGDRIDAVNGVPVANPRELVTVWRAQTGATIELTLQREQSQQITITKPAPSGEVNVSWATRKAPLVASVQLSGGATYSVQAGQPGSLQQGQSGISFEYSPEMLWPNDLLVAINGVPGSTPTAFDEALEAVSGTIVLGIQREVEPPQTADTTCSCLDFLWRTKPAARTSALGAVVTTTSVQNI